MRQRVALARALAQDADVLLMDEPFGALDAMTRDILHDELERIWRERSLTVLFVTHNVREAVRLGDRVILLSSRPGRIIEDFPVEHARPRRIDSPEVSEPGRRPSPTGSARRCPAMPTDVPGPAGLARPSRVGTAAGRHAGNRSADRVTGMDALELGPGRTGAGRPARPARSGRALWPKVLAIAIVVTAWQLVVPERMEAGVRAARRPATVFADLARPGAHRATSGTRDRHHHAPGAHRLRRSPW